jgi:hypothetical protein
MRKKLLVINYKLPNQLRGYPNVTITVRHYFTETHKPLKVINLYLCGIVSSQQNIK